MEVNTFELHNLTQDERIYYYGQDDHVRLYGRDFKEHLQNYGLRVDVYSPEELLSKKLTEKLKIISNDKLFICSCC